MLFIPLGRVPSQMLTVALGGQRCTIKVYQRRAYVQAPEPAPTVDSEDADALEREQGGAIELDEGT